MSIPLYAGHVSSEYEMLCLSHGKLYPFRPLYLEHCARMSQEGISPELGEGQLELHTGVCTLGGQVTTSLTSAMRIVRGYLPDDVQVLATPYAPRYAETGEEMLQSKTLSPRHMAILHGLREEAREKWTRVGDLGVAQSSQFHLSLFKKGGTYVDMDPTQGTVAGECANLLVNYLNNIAPYVALRVGGLYHTGNPSKRLRLWFAYCLPHRQPQYAWYPCAQDRVEAFAQVPRLIALRERGGEEEWVILPQGGSSLLDVSDAGLNRDLARLCPPKEGKSAWTVEFRPCSVLPTPKAVGEVADFLRNVVEIVWNYAMTRGCDALGIEDAHKLFAHVHKRHPMLVPKRPLKREEWYRYVGWDAT